MEISLAVSHGRGRPGVPLRLGCSGAGSWLREPPGGEEGGFTVSAPRNRFGVSAANTTHHGWTEGGGFSSLLKGALAAAIFFFPLPVLRNVLKGLSAQGT